MPNKTPAITLKNVTRSNVKDIPMRTENETTYKSLLIVPSRRKHDSGFTQIQVIGVKGKDELEMCTTFSDDINWYLPSVLKDEYFSIRTDVFYPSGIMRMWSNYFDFKVEWATSSLSIKIVKREKQNA